MTTSQAATSRPLSALELVVDCLARVRVTDPTDTTAVLLAAWHGFGIAEAAGARLAADNPDDAVLARNAAPLFAAVAAHLVSAPSLPYTEPCVEPVDDLIPHAEQSSAATDVEPAAVVRQSILALALELNTLLPNAADHARLPADRAACQHGTRLSYELSRCWEGRLDTFLNHARGDLVTPSRTTAQPRRRSRRG